MDEQKLQAYLRKCELQYRADNTPGGGMLDWLAPYCDSVDDIASFLRSIGFRIKAIADATESHDCYQWVTTTSGVIVYVNDEYCKGLFAKEAHNGLD